MKKKLAVVIPFYNEEKSILRVVNEWISILNTKDMDLILVNDGSVDNSIKILKKIKKKYKNLFIINKKNGGHGSAIIKGYSYAVKKPYSFVFQTDSDEQFISKNFRKIWNQKNKKFDLILGNRKIRHDPLIRIILSRFILNPLLKSYFGRKTIDPNIPYRLIEINFLKRFLATINKNYVAPNILMTLFSKKKHSIVIDHFQRETGELSWSITRLFKFGLKLLFDLNDYKKKLKLHFK
jgi:dolichol-phosphate mannosyltransferase